MYKLPHKLPAKYATTGTVTSTPVDTGGYDVLIGSLGFRLASDTNDPYQRQSDQLSTTRPDQSAENGEQNLTALPWVKAQSTFHGGAGQLSFESTTSDVVTAHTRFDTSFNADVWTPGKVTRLPDMIVQAQAPALTGTLQFVAMCSCLSNNSPAGSSDLTMAMNYQNADLWQMVWAYEVVGGLTSLTKVAAPTYPGGTTNVVGYDVVSDGKNYHALTLAYNAGAGTYTYNVLRGAMNSTAAPIIVYTTSAFTGGIPSQLTPAALGWVKSRLMAGIGQNLYELSITASAGSTLPLAKYTAPSPTWTWTAFAEAPDGVLAAGNDGVESTAVKLTLDTSSLLPTLSGGSSEISLPENEIIYSMLAYLGSFLILGTTSGLRYGTYDSYTGKLKISPIVVRTTLPVLALAGRDRFVYGSYTNQMADGSSGLFRVDLSNQVDQQGFVAWAPDLVMPVQSSAVAINTQPSTGLMIVCSANGIWGENGSSGSVPTPGTVGPSWVRTSRIRYGTAEPKLFKLGRVRGALNTSQIQVSAQLPYQTAVNCGTFGFTANDTTEFRIADGTWEWVQMVFNLQGASCEMNAYQVKGYPQPRRSRIIRFTVNCFSQETDKTGQDVTDALDPRSRMLALEALEQAGGEVILTEFTTVGAVTYRTIIEEISFSAVNRPTLDNDFGGTITIQLRTTE